MSSIQIGVMGSVINKALQSNQINMAKKIGVEIAKSKSVLIFGIEPDSNSLPMIAAESAKVAGGISIGVSPGTKKTNHSSATYEIISGIERGGGREFVLVNSCHVIITIGGGSGTLTEIAIAYQANIPIISISGSRGWSDKLAGTYLDSRKRFKIAKASCAQSAIQKAIASVKL